MAAVTLQAKERLRRVQQRIVYRPVRCMTVPAVFCNVGMFKDKRPLLFHVTAGTGLFDAVPLEHFFLSRTMGVMTIGARHLFLPQGMMGKIGIFRLDLRVAAVAHLRHFGAPHLLLRPLMQFMAIKATDVMQGMLARIPMGQGRDGCGSMTLETDQ